VSGYPMIDALNATHPLTPREKVAQIIKEKVSGPHFTDPSHFVAMEQDRFAAADAILTALASGSGDHSGGVTDMIGSGDHAELARLSRKAREEMTCEATTDALCDGVDALLAEIAALRARLETARFARVEHNRQFEEVRDRATEAERKLAEAVGLLRETIEPYEHISDVRAFEVMRHGVAQKVVAIRTFLGKEAERG